MFLGDTANVLFTFSHNANGQQCSDFPVQWKPCITDTLPATCSKMTTNTSDSSNNRIHQNSEVYKREVAKQATTTTTNKFGKICALQTRSPGASTSTSISSGVNKNYATRFCFIVNTMYFLLYECIAGARCSVVSSIQCPYC